MALSIESLAFKICQRILIMKGMGIEDTSVVDVVKKDLDRANMSKDSKMSKELRKAMKRHGLERFEYIANAMDAT